MRMFIVDSDLKIGGEREFVLSMKLKELCHGVFIYFSDLTKLFSH